MNDAFFAELKRTSPDEIQWCKGQSTYASIVEDLIDAETGKSLKGQHVWRANRAEGWYDRFILDANGMVQRDPVNGVGVLSERVHRPIEFILKDRP